MAWVVREWVDGLGGVEPQKRGASRRSEPAEDKVVDLMEALEAVKEARGSKPRPAVPDVPGVVKGMPAEHVCRFEYSPVVSKHICRGCGEVKK